MMLALFITGCELEDYSELTGETDDEESVQPVGHGLGTQLKPYTPTELLDGDATSGQQAWVMGYAVGSTYQSMKNAVFSVPTTYSRNILLATDTLCTDPTQCIAVELTTTARQEKFSLASQPERLHQLVVVQGTLGTYFSQAGVREVTDGYWLPDFYPSFISTTPEEWSEIESTY